MARNELHDGAGDDTDRRDDRTARRCPAQHRESARDTIDERRCHERSPDAGQEIRRPDGRTRGTAPTSPRSADPCRVEGVGRRTTRPSSSSDDHDRPTGSVDRLRARGRVRRREPLRSLIVLPRIACRASRRAGRSAGSGPRSRAAKMTPIAKIAASFSIIVLHQQRRPRRRRSPRRRWCSWSGRSAPARAGAITARKACGSTMSRRFWAKVRPSERPASAWPSGTVLMPERRDSQTNAAV